MESLCSCSALSRAELPHTMSWQIFTEGMKPSKMAGDSGLAPGKHFSLCCLSSSIMRSCLDKFYGRFLLWGGKRFSFSFYSLLIAKAILQWLISTFLPELLNHPGSEQAWASFQKQGFSFQPYLPIFQRKLCISTPVWGIEWKWEVKTSPEDPGDVDSE